MHYIYNINAYKYCKPTITCIYMFRKFLTIGRFHSIYLSGLREKYSDESSAGNSGSSNKRPVARHSRLSELKS